MCNLGSKLTVAEIGFSTVKHSKRRVVRWFIKFVQFKVKVGTRKDTQKDVFCGGVPHLRNFKSELTLAKIGLSIAKHSKRRVLLWNIVRVQFKVRVDSCKKRICIVNDSKRRVLRWVIAFVQLKVRLGTCTKLIFHSITRKNTHFEVEKHICAISGHT